MNPPKKPSGEHPAVVSFKETAAQIRDVTIPAMQRSTDKAAAILASDPPPPASVTEEMAGDWVIVIRGHGAHHNVRETDANRMLSGFVRDLRRAGQKVTHASFQNGSEEHVHDSPEALASTETTGAPAPEGEKKT